MSKANPNDWVQAEAPKATVNGPTTEYRAGGSKLKDTDKGFYALMAALRGDGGGTNVVIGVRQEAGASRQTTKTVKPPTGGA